MQVAVLADETQVSLADFNAIFNAAKPLTQLRDATVEVRLQLQSCLHIPILQMLLLPRRLLPVHVVCRNIVKHQLLVP